jgi:hypothetical protein
VKSGTNDGASRVALLFKKAAAVAVGTFNIYVIQPKWLAEVGIWPEGTKIQMASDLNRPGFRYRSEEFSAQWEVRPDRLILHTESANDDCGKTLADVLEKLPWTPLFGVGVNVEFHGDLNELKELPRSCSLPSGDGPDGYEVKQRTCHVGLLRSGQIFNLQLSASEKAELSINVHTELRDKGKQEHITKLAQEACRAFIELRDEAVKLAKRTFALELSYE